MKPHVLNNPSLSSDIDNELNYIMKSWRDISMMLFTEIADFSEIEDFTQEVCSRLAFINNKYGKKCTTLFKPRVT